MKNILILAAILGVIFWGCEFNSAGYDKHNKDKVDGAGEFCGDSGLKCKVGEVCLECVGGKYCGCKEAGKASCEAGGVCATDLMSDPHHCGKCGEKCMIYGDAVLGKDMKCEEGECVCYHDGKPVILSEGVGIIIDGKAAVTHCGTCGYTCSVKGSTIKCRSGRCVDTRCPNKGEMMCDGLCVDTSRDSKHCKDCSIDCGDRACVEGECVCETGMTDCSGICINVIGDDTGNCGDCGVNCSDGMVCNGGTCEYSPGLGDCDGQADNGCETLLGTASNCGRCGEKCSDGNICNGGKCECRSCMKDCEGTCINVMGDDAENCGDCGKQCDAEEICVGGDCKVLCGMNMAVCGEGTACRKSDGSECSASGFGCFCRCDKAEGNGGDVGEICELETPNCSLGECDSNMNCSGGIVVHENGNGAGCVKKCGAGGGCQSSGKCIFAGS